MKRAPVNPWSWSLQVGYHQAEILEGSRRQLVCAGQTAFDADGAPRHPGDMRRQMALAPDNLEAVLKGADMGLADITCLRVYATDVDEALKHFDVLGERFGPLDASPPMTLLGVTRRALPGLMLELEAIAADQVPFDGSSAPWSLVPPPQRLAPLQGQRRRPIGSGFAFPQSSGKCRSSAREPDGVIRTAREPA